MKTDAHKFTSEQQALLKHQVIRLRLGLEKRHSKLTLCLTGNTVSVLNATFMGLSDGMIYPIPHFS